MAEIKCPNCGKMFQVDEAGYVAIVNQVKNEEFNKELEVRIKELSKQKESEKDNALQQAQIKTNELIANLKQEIATLKVQQQNAEKEKENAVNLATNNANNINQQALNQKNTEIAELKHKLENKENEKLTALQQVELKKTEEISKLNNQIVILKAEQKNIENQNEYFKKYINKIKKDKEFSELQKSLFNISILYNISHNISYIKTISI